MISVMPGQGPPVDVEGSQDENAGVGGDEDIPDMMPAGAESAREADAGEPALLSDRAQRPNGRMSSLRHCLKTSKDTLDPREVRESVQ